MRRSSPKASPLAWPVRIEGEEVLILDETLLPQRVCYLKVKDYREAVQAIAQMKTRAFGQLLTLFYTLLLTAKKNRKKKGEALLEILKDTAFEIEKSRPTFPFHDFTSLILHWAQDAHRKGKDITSFLEERIEEFFEKIRKKGQLRARKTASLIKDGDTILTHCNVSGALVAIGNICREQRKKIRFIVTETRPYLQGARLTAWELKEAGFPVTLIADSAVAKVMAEGMVDLVIVGSDRSAKNGDIVNKVGTYQIALIAREFRVPFYVLTQPSRKGVASGGEIPIEERDPEELLSYRGVRIAPERTKGYYPGFDVTPSRYITKAIPVEVG